MRVATLEDKLVAMDAHVEAVENWFFGQSPGTPHERIYEPERFKKSPGGYYVKHENVIVGANIIMWDLGQFDKVVTLGSDDYCPMEIPAEIWDGVMDIVLSDGETHYAPRTDPLIEHPPYQGRRPKIRLIATWFPPDGFVKQLMEKRNVMTEAQFEAIMPIIKKVYEGDGVKPPGYISKALTVQVPEKVH